VKTTKHRAPRRRTPAPDLESLEAAARVFRAAGDLARLRLLERLADGDCCVGDLALAFETPMPTISQQLRVLHQAGLVTRRREGKHVHYALADHHVVELIHNAIAHAGH
jgi:ArsR family transcriptional regulator, lead/cadmium/zinc/bismuth-responsive transcriptional repressor